MDIVNVSHTLKYPYDGSAAAGFDVDWTHSHPCVVFVASTAEVDIAFVQESLDSSVVSGPRQQLRAMRTSTASRGMSLVATTPR